MRSDSSARGPGVLSYREETLSYGEEDHESIDDSLEEQHVGHNMIKFSDMKDDK